MKSTSTSGNRGGRNPRAWNRSRGGRPTLGKTRKVDDSVIWNFEDISGRGAALHGPRECSSNPVTAANRHSRDATPMCYACGLLEHNMKRCLTAGFAALAMVCALVAQSQQTFKARLSPVAVDTQLVSVITGHGAVSAVLSGTKLTVTGTFEGMHSAA